MACEKAYGSPDWFQAQRSASLIPSFQAKTCTAIVSPSSIAAPHGQTLIPNRFALETGYYTKLLLVVSMLYWLDECSGPLRRDYTTVARAASPQCRAELPERLKNGYDRDTGVSSRLALVSGPKADPADG